MALLAFSLMFYFLSAAGIASSASLSNAQTLKAAGRRIKVRRHRLNEHRMLLITDSFILFTRCSFTTG